MEKYERLTQKPQTKNIQQFDNPQGFEPAPNDPTEIQDPRDPNPPQNVWEAAKRSPIGMKIAAGFASAAMIGAGAAGTAMANASNESESQISPGNTPTQPKAPQATQEVDRPSADAFSAYTEESDTAIAGISLAYNSNTESTETLSADYSDGDKTAGETINSTDSVELKRNEATSSQNRASNERNRNWLRLKRYCARAGLVMPEIIRADMVNPGSKKGNTQKVLIEGRSEAMPEKCHGRFKRFISTRTQMQDANNPRRLLNIDRWQLMDSSDRAGVGGTYSTPTGHEGDWVYYKCTPGKNITRVRSLIQNKVVINKPRRVYNIPGEPGLYTKKYPVVAKKIRKIPIEVERPC